MSDAPGDIRELFERALAEGTATIEAATDLASLEDARVRALGRKAPLSRARTTLREVPEDQRKPLGLIANDVQQRLEQLLERKRAEFEASEMRARWERERIDVTLPGDAPPVGSLHPLTRTMWRVINVFLGLGYKVVEGPEVELATYNFDALNTPPQHPARSMQDTFYVEGRGEDVCMRTQTSPVQIRAMESRRPPVYVVVPGRCYRKEAVDATHLNVFTQIEGLAVDVGITMGDLRGSLELAARALFGQDLEVRLRPHYFPFTEPSGEMDVQCFVCRGSGCSLCKGEGWIEILGCGMVHPFLLEWVGYDPERYTGFAFGMGVERIAALSHGVNDIRYFWENDIRFLDHFRGAA